MDYPFNRRAYRLVYVETRFDYIIESNEDGPHVNVPHLEEKYTAHKVYQYLLELDDKDIIVGGEWLNATMKDHPDFLWVPTDFPESSSTAFGMKYKEIKKMIEVSRNSVC